MDDQRVPNLEEMDEQQAHRFLTELYSNLSPEEDRTYAVERECLLARVSTDSE